MISGSARAQSGAGTFKNEVSGGYLYGDSLAPYEAYGDLGIGLLYAEPATDVCLPLASLSGPE